MLQSEVEQKREAFGNFACALLLSYRWDDFRYVGESWWCAYMRLIHILPEMDDRQVLLRNYCNFYEEGNIVSGRPSGGVDDPQEEGIVAGGATNEKEGAAAEADGLEEGDVSKDDDHDGGVPSETLPPCPPGSGTVVWTPPCLGPGSNPSDPQSAALLRVDSYLAGIIVPNPVVVMDGATHDVDSQDDVDANYGDSERERGGGFPPAGLYCDAFDAAVLAGTEPEPLFVFAQPPEGIDADGLRAFQYDLNYIPTKVLQLGLLAVEDMLWVEPKPLEKGGLKQKIVIQPFPGWRPTISQCGLHWRLNKRQYYCFVVLAWGILRGVASRVHLNPLVNADCRKKYPLYDDLDKLINDMNEAMYSDRADLDFNLFPTLKPLETTLTVRLQVVGQAGMGKSHISECVKDFARSWSMLDCVVFTCTTGTLAVQMRCSTTWKACGANLYWNIGAGKKLKEKQDTWSPVSLLGIDEAGKLKSSDLLGFEKAARKLKDPTVPFGGINLFTTGDNLQPGQAGSVPYSVMKAPTHKDYMTECEGVMLYRSFPNAVVELTEGNRTHDQRLADLNDHLSINNVSAEDVDKLKSTVAPSGAPPIVVPDGGKLCCHSNEDVHLTNNLLVKRLCQSKPCDPASHQHEMQGWRGRGVLVIVGTVTPNDPQQPLTDAEMRELLGMNPADVAKYAPKSGAKGSSRSSTGKSPDSSSMRVSPQLFFVLGMPYRVTKSVRPSAGVANGTIAIARDVLFVDGVDEDNVVFWHTDLSWGGGFHCVSAVHVKGLLLKHQNVSWSNEFFNPNDKPASGNVDEEEDVPGSYLPGGWFPLEKVVVPVCVKRGTGKAVHLSCFPLALAIVVTGDSLQGTTLLFLYVLTFGKQLRNMMGYVYMLVSRLCELDGLHLSSSCKIELDPTNYKLRLAPMEEQDRIRLLADRFYAFIQKIVHPSLDVETSKFFMSVAQYRERGSMSAGTAVLTKSKSVVVRVLPCLHRYYMHERLTRCMVPFSSSNHLVHYLDQAQVLFLSPNAKVQVTTLSMYAKVSNVPKVFNSVRLAVEATGAGNLYPDAMADDNAVLAFENVVKFYQSNLFGVNSTLGKVIVMEFADLRPEVVLPSVVDVLAKDPLGLMCDAMVMAKLLAGIDERHVFYDLRCAKPNTVLHRSVKLGQRVQYRLSGSGSSYQSSGGVTYVVVGGDGIVFFDVDVAVDFAFRLPAGPGHGLAGAAGGSVHGDGPGTAAPAPSVPSPRFLLGDVHKENVLSAYRAILAKTAQTGIVLFQVQAVLNVGATGKDTGLNPDPHGQSTSTPAGCVAEAAKVKAAAAVAAAERLKALVVAAAAAVAAKASSSSSLSSSASSSSASVPGAAGGLGVSGASAPPPALCDVALSGQDARNHTSWIALSSIQPPKVAGLLRNRASIDRLQPDVHVDDDCVNDFLLLAGIESDRWPQSPSVYVVQSHLLPLLRRGAAGDLLKIPKFCVNAKGSRRLFGVDLVVVPVHDPGNVHWYLVVACLRESPSSVFHVGFTVFNSLAWPAGMVTPTLDLLRLYLLGEFERMRADLPERGVESAEGFRCPGWLKLPMHQVYYELSDMPIQINDDCGVFTMRAALAVLLGLRPNPANLPLHRFAPNVMCRIYRERVALDLWMGRIQFTLPCARPLATVVGTLSVEDGGNGFSWQALKKLGPSHRLHHLPQSLDEGWVVSNLPHSLLNCWGNTCVQLLGPALIACLDANRRYHGPPGVRGASRGNYPCRLMFHPSVDLIMLIMRKISLKIVLKPPATRVSIVAAERAHRLWLHLCRPDELIVHRGNDLQAAVTAVLDSLAAECPSIYGFFFFRLQFEMQCGRCTDNGILVQNFVQLPPLNDPNQNRYSSLCLTLPPVPLGSRLGRLPDPLSLKDLVVRYFMQNADMDDDVRDGPCSQCACALAGVPPSTRRITRFALPLPVYLVVYVQRLYTELQGIDVVSRKRHDVLAKYTDDLDFGAFSVGGASCQYELLSVGAHEGNGYVGGHYLYYGRVPGKDQWVSMNCLDSRHRNGKVVLCKADGLIADRQELQNGRTEVKDVGSEVCMFLFRVKDPAYCGQVASASASVCCRPDDVPARLSWEDLSMCQATANNSTNEAGFAPLVQRAVRLQRSREAISAPARPAGSGTGAAGVCTPVSKTGEARLTPSSPILRNLPVEGDRSVPVAPSGSVPVVSAGRAPKALCFSANK
jgi:hypothetical protein